jgi:hypothetical protein
MLSISTSTINKQSLEYRKRNFSAADSFYFQDFLEQHDPGAISYLNSVMAFLFLNRISIATYVCC